MNGKTIGFILAALLMLSACRRIQRFDRPYADNPEMQEKVRKSFNLAIALPADMQSSKQGKDFFWLSNNAASGMKNVVIYRIRSCDTLPLSVERFCELRDSVMKINIKGEEDSMYVATVKASVKGRFYPKSRRCRYEGLWEMKGDAMGGPFVSDVYERPDRHGLIIAEGFLYAPETNEKNTLLSQLRAILGSINIINNGK